MVKFTVPRIDDKVIEEVTDVLRSGWITTGPKTKELESLVTSMCGNIRTIAVSSATAGLELMLRWFGIGPGDEVIVPVYTYCATANVVVHCGAKPVFVDVDKKDLTISVQAIRKAITAQTKVIIPVDLGGMPCDYDLINKLVAEPEIKSMFNASTGIQEKLGRILVMADAAHSIGSEYKGRMAGNLTDITVFSFHAVKNVTTAEGGAICLNLPAEAFDCDEIYKYLNVKSLHGQTKDAFTKTMLGSWEYDVIEPGFKANMTDVHAAIGLVELKRYHENLEKRKEIVDRYDKQLGKYNWAELPILGDQGRRSSFHLYLLRIKGIERHTRNLILDEIFSREVAVNVHYKPLTELSYYMDPEGEIQFPNAYDSYNRVITLPVYYDLSVGDQQKVIEAVTESVQKLL